jgi:hypothetical protein
VVCHVLVQLGAFARVRANNALSAPLLLAASSVTDAASPPAEAVARASAARSAT